MIGMYFQIHDESSGIYQWLRSAEKAAQ